MTIEHERAYPSIPWDEPLAVTMNKRSGFACRRCVADKGLRGHESDRLFRYAHECREHNEREHPRPRANE